MSITFNFKFINFCDTAADVALSTGELVVDTIDTITPDISSDD